jgi:hypothetical protein
MRDARQGNLFDTGHYPETPGYKEPLTSAAAAHSMRDRALTLRARIIRALEVYGFLTTDEAARILNESVLSIRPRFSELLLQGKIYKTLGTRKNVSGKEARVWGLMKEPNK